MTQETFFYISLIGIGATVAMDLYAILIKKLFAIPSLNYALLGRWLLLMPRGQLVHQNIASTHYIRGEVFIGWSAHYAIGVIFAFIFISITGLNWLSAPELLPILLFSCLSVSLPFFIMQPCFGMGFAASRLPSANQARLKSICTHLVFGLGVYVSALLVNLF
ncbi:DUF2938 domain-containing protein [Pseudoalteromonas sp. MTN2-4]|uniref:DUF2938 domain-containing protein n=1 Tax=Pseudoalteromonas sp. MTN2-4 TaxID=3056555 RepID=UPI0036F1B132